MRAHFERKKPIERKLRIRKESAFHQIAWFQNNLKPWPANIISFLRLDGDWHEITKVCLENLCPALAPGGTALLDDYFYWQGCRKACGEICRRYSAVEKIFKSIRIVDIGRRPS